MNLSTFLKHLRSIKGWNLTVFGRIVHNRSRSCPIEAVAAKISKKGYKHFAGNISRAASVLKLGEVGCRIIHAADGEETPLRKSLLKACNLKEA